MEKQNCPNCGAIISEEKCPYCGTMFYDFSAIDFDKPCFIKFKKDGKIMRLCVRLKGLKYSMEPDIVTLYAGNQSIYQYNRPVNRELNLNFTVVPHTNEVVERDDVISEIVDLNEVTSDTKGW